MSRPFEELIARANAAGARALEYLGEDWNEVVEAARSALLLHVTEPPTIRPLESEPRPEQQQTLREMALALAEMDPYLCGLPQTHTEGQLAHRSALARDRAIAAMVNYTN